MSQMQSNNIQQKPKVINIVWTLQGRKKFLGRVIDDVFYTKREFKHKFINYDGFGFNFDLIKSLKAMKVRKVVLDYEGQSYEISIDDILRYGIEKEFFPYEKQIIVNINYFKPIKKEG